MTPPFGFFLSLYFLFLISSEVNYHNEETIFILYIYIYFFLKNLDFLQNFIKILFTYDSIHLMSLFMLIQFSLYLPLFLLFLNFSLLLYFSYVLFTFYNFDPLLLGCMYISSSRTSSLYFITLFCDFSY